MMPSAKIVICERFLPENMSYRPNMEFAAWSAISLSASEFTPGVGMWPPTRYTASNPSVKSTRLRRSLTATMFFSESASIAPPLRQHLCRAARGGDFFRGLAAELVRANRQLLRDVAAREHLDAARARDEPVRAQQLRCHFSPGVELLRDRVEVHHLVLDAERVVEPALRHAAVQRHLAALEPALVLEARTRFRALVSTAGGLAVAGSLAAADALLRMRRALRRTKIAQIHDAIPPPR